MSERGQRVRLTEHLVQSIPELGALSKLHNFIVTTTLQSSKRNLLRTTCLLSNGPGVQPGALHSIFPKIGRAHV